MYYMLLMEGGGEKYNNNEIKSGNEKIISSGGAAGGDRSIEKIYYILGTRLCSMFFDFFLLIGIHRYLIQSKGTSVIQNNVCK
jgi:hypothetical protein